MVWSNMQRFSPACAVIERIVSLERPRFVFGSEVRPCADVDTASCSLVSQFFHDTPEAARFIELARRRTGSVLVGGIIRLET